LSVVSGSPNRPVSQSPRYRGSTGDGVALVVDHIAVAWDEAAAGFLRADSSGALQVSQFGLHVGLERSVMAASFIQPNSPDESVCVVT
jgi:hypothetical protein